MFIFALLLRDPRMTDEQSNPDAERSVSDDLVIDEESGSDADGKDGLHN